METEQESRHLILKLKHYQIQNGWIYGVLMNDNKIICDTLEIDSLYNLEDEVYRIYAQINPTTKENEILIYNKYKTINSKFTAINHIKYKSIHMRLDNNLVTVGTKINEPLLTNSDIMFKQLFDFIKSYELIDTKIYMQVINQIK